MPPSRVEMIEKEVKMLATIVQQQKLEFDYHSKDHIYLEKRLEVAENDNKLINDRLQEMSTNLAILVARGDERSNTTIEMNNGNREKKDWSIKVANFVLYCILFLLAFPNAYSAFVKIIGGK